jgi:hypothetical protein
MGGVRCCTLCSMTCGLRVVMCYWPTARLSADDTDTLWNYDPLLGPSAVALESQVAATWPQAARKGGFAWMRLVAQIACTLGRVPTPRENSLGDTPLALKWLLRELSRSGGVALAFEGLDDADDQWIEIISDLSRELALDLPVLVVAMLTLAQPLGVLDRVCYTELQHPAHTLQQAGEAELLWLEQVTSAESAVHIDQALRRRRTGCTRSPMACR